MNDEEAKLRILISTVFDERAAKMAAESLKKVKEEAKGTGGEIGKTTDQFSKMGKSSGDLLSSITKVGVVLTAAVAPINAAAKSYVQSVGMAEATSRQWLEQNYRIEQSYERIGRMAAEKLLPIKKLQADLMEGLADLTEEKPGMVGGGTAVLGGLGALGGMSLLAKILRGGAAASGGGILGALGLGGAGATATGAAGGAAGTGMLLAPEAAGAASLGVLPLVGASIATILGMGAVKQAILKSIKDPDMIRAINSLETLSPEQQKAANRSLFPALNAAAYGSMNLQAGAQVETDSVKTPLDRLADVIEKLIDALTGQSDAKTGQEFVPTQTLARMRQYEIQERYAQEDYNRQRFVAARDFNRQMAYSEADFYRQRGYTLRDFNISMAFTEKMFYLQRQIAQRDFNISLARNEYDYLLNRKRAAEDHNFSLKQIMLSGDALSYYYAQRQFNIDQRRAEEDYQRQRSRSIEDFNRGQGDSLMFFNLQRAQQVKQFEISLADQQREFEIQRARSWEQFSIQMSDVEYQYRKERTRRWESFREQILPEILTEAEYRALIQRNLTSTMIANFNELMVAFATSWSGFMNNVYQSQGLGYPSIGGRAEGGYTEHKPYMLHEGEFVLNPATTRAAEQVAQGTLTQDKIVSLLTGGGGFVYNDSRQFARGLTAEEKSQIRRETKQIVMEMFK